MKIKMKMTSSSQKKGVILFIYLIYLFIFTLSPFSFSLFWFEKLASYRLDELIIYLLHFNPLDHVNNIILFIPFGLILRHYFWKENPKKQNKWRMPLLSGMMLSLIIESTQLFLVRSTTINDVVMNTVGAIVGFRLIDFPLVGNIIYLLKKQSHSLSLTLATLSSIAFLGICLRPLELNDLNRWNDHFPLLIGNEISMNRPWEGSIYHLSIYNQALNGKQALQLHNRGLNEKMEKEREAMGCIASFYFDEGKGQRILDSKKQIALIGENIHWLNDQQGIQIHQGQILKSDLSSQEITNKIKQTHQFSVEVLIRTDHIHQGGPARIVSLSGGTDRRNFTLGQQGQQIHLRVRTRLAGPNGSKINIRAKSVLKADSLYHLVATFNRGFERLYVNGFPHKDMIRAHLDFSPHLMLLGTNWVSKLAFCFIFAFSMGFLFYGGFRANRLLWTLAICTIVFVYIEGLMTILIGQPPALFLIIVSLIFTILGIYLKKILEL